MFSEDDLTESWTDEQCQRTTCHKVVLNGPFTNLPYRTNNLTWTSIKGTEGRYDVALSIGPESVPLTDEKCFISLHLRQNFQQASGVDVTMDYQILSRNTDEATVTDSKSLRMLYSESKAGSWRVVNDFIGYPDFRAHPSVTKDNQICIAFKLTEPRDLDPKFNAFPYDLVNTLADCLQRPNDGDILFECPSDKNGQTRNLYAHSTVLKARSKYYANMFASSFSEGDSAAANRYPGSQESLRSLENPRRKITMVEDFDIVHNILYYLYASRITFSTSTTGSEESSTESTYPRICDAEDIYALAHRLELEALQSKALRFLKSTCNVRNITSRVLSQFASIYEEVGQVYESFFKENWKEVRLTAEYREFFSAVEEIEDLKEIRRIYTKLREIMEEAVFVTK